MKDAEKQVGDVWAYREKPYNEKCPLVPVEILQIGPPRSNRVRVRFREGEFAGMDQWVQRNGLRIPWEDVEAWLRDEELFNAFARISQVDWKGPEYQAAEQVYWVEGLEGDVSLMSAAKYGAILQIGDVPAFARQLGIDVEDLSKEPGAFVDRFGLFQGPWPLILRLAPIIARKFAEVILERVQKEQEKLEEEAADGYYFRWSRKEPEQYVPPERCAERLRETLPKFEIIRRWCGVDSVDKFDELIGLRREVASLRTLVESAAKTLADAGKHHAARSLRKQLVEIEFHANPDAAEPR